jgi:hypothetical protein
VKKDKNTWGLSHILPCHPFGCSYRPERTKPAVLVSRYTNSTTGDGGILLRWDRAATLGATPALTEASATWKMSAATGMLNMHGPAISLVDGNVYVLFTHSTSTNVNNGVYLVGNVSAATLTKTLAPADRVVDTTTVNGTGWATSNTYATVKCDAVGNFVIMDRSQEQVRMYTPGGTSAITTPAPTSQALTITPASGVEDWGVY